MAVWLRDHVLPGLIVTVLVSASHLRLWQRIKKLTRDQNQHIDEVTAEQTRALQDGGRDGGRP
jgi:hypothetical protein